MIDDEFEKHLPGWAVIIKRLYEEARKEKVKLAE